MALNDFNFTEPNYIKEYLSQNVLSPKEAYLVSIKFSKITIPYISVKDIIIQVEYQNKFYRYYVFSKKPLYLPYPNNIKEKNRIKLHLLFNTSLKTVIIGKGSFHINKDNITSKIFEKIMKITLSKEKLCEIGINLKKNDNSDINGTIFIEGNIINKSSLNKANYYISTNYNVNNSNNKSNSKSTYHLGNKKMKNNLNNISKLKSKKIKKIKEDKILIGNKKRTANKIEKRFNFDLDLIDDNSLKFNYLSRDEFSNKSNISNFSSFDLNDKFSKNIQDNINMNINNNLNFYNNKINKNFNNDLINKLKEIKIKDEIYKNNEDVNIDLLKNISSNIDIKEQKLNKIYQDYYNNKNNSISSLKEKGIQSYKNYNEIKKVLKATQNEYDENKKKYDKKRNEINDELNNIINNNNNGSPNSQNDSIKTLNDLFFSLSYKESDYFNNNKFINNNNNFNINSKKNIKDNDLQTMIEILSSFPTDKIDILKGLTNLEKQDAVLIINSNLNKVFEEEKKMNLYNNENYNFDVNDFKKEDNDDSSEDKESNTIIQIIEKCVNSYYNKKLIPKIQIEQIDTYHYTFENLKVELAMDPEKENNLITSEGENFELWLVKNFAS